MKLKLSFQITFQAILITDGKLSFMLSIYDSAVAMVINDIPFFVGVDAGEGLQVSSFNTRQSLSLANTFLGYRIDGRMLLMFLISLH